MLNRHPWIFSGAIDSIGSALSDGDVADVVNHDGAFLARGAVNRRSQIVVRLLTWRRDEPVDAAFFTARIARAVSARPTSGPARLIHAESDGLPGLVVDRYGDYCVMQVSALGMDAQKTTIVEALASIVAPHGIYERSDVEGREKEGLKAQTGLLNGREPPDLVHVDERTHDGQSVTLLVDVRRGHKTGTYLDQANNRRSVGAVANGAQVLNLFSYTGAFALHAAKAGAAHVVNVDSSAEALALSKRTAEENGLASRVEHVRADAFDALRRFREEGRMFDVVIVDPPKFAHTAGQVEPRGPRLQGSVARRVSFGSKGRVSGDVFVLGCGLRRSLPENRVERFHRSRARGANRRTFHSTGRSSRAPQLSRRRVLEGLTLSDRVTVPSPIELAHNRGTLRAFLVAGGTGG